MESPPPLVLTRSVDEVVTEQQVREQQRQWREQDAAVSADPEKPAASRRDSSDSTSSSSGSSSRSSSSGGSSSDGSSDHDGDLEKVPTNATGHQSFLQRVISNGSPIVPRSQRRGLFAYLSLIPEVQKPTDYTFRVKVLVTCVVAAAGASAPMASGILYPSLGMIAEEFNAERTVVNLTVATYMLGMAVFPLWWSSFAERWGYRTIFLISFMLYIISSIACAVSVNVAMLIVFRICSGASAASAQSLGAGIIASIWDTHQRGEAMGYFYLGPLCGPLVSPVLGGIFTQAWGWRSSQWFLTIFGAVVWLLILFALPETLPRKHQQPTPTQIAAKEHPDTDGDGNGAPLTLTRTLTRISTHTKKSLSLMKVLFILPLRSLLFLRFPPVFLTVLYASMAFGSLYVLNVSIQTVFAESPYHFSSILVGLLYIPGALGNLLSSVIGGRWNDIVMRRAAEHRRRSKFAGEQIPADEPLEYRPEDRMSWNAVVAGCLFPGSLLWYAWVAENGVHWIVPAIAMFCFGLGAMLVFSMATTMLTEFVPGKSSSAVAVNNFCRNIIACVGSVVVAPITKAIGVGYFFTIVAGMGFCMLPIVWVMHRWGPKWRRDVEKYRKYM